MMVKRVSSSNVWSKYKEIGQRISWWWKAEVNKGGMLIGLQLPVVDEWQCNVGIKRGARVDGKHAGQHEGELQAVVEWHR